MRHLLLSTTILIALTSPALAQESSVGLCDYYGGHVDVEGKLGSQRDIGETSVFIPVACSEDKLLFGDIRFRADNQSTREGNLGLGARLLKEDGVLGGYVYYDRKISGLTRKTHDQITAGAEWLAENWEVRTNGYIPLTGEQYKHRSTSAAAFVSGTNIFTIDASSQILTERPLWGGDIEAGVKVPDSKFWLYAGAFSFNGEDTPSLDGVRTRIKFDLTDNIALTAEGQYDDERGRQGWVGAKFTVPFGGPDEKNTGLKARMTASPVRDIDIITKTTADRPLATAVAAINNDTGQAQRVIYVNNTGSTGGDGSRENPYNTLAQAQANLRDYDILYVASGDGTSRGMDQGIVIDKRNIQMIGSGSTLVYDGAKLTTTSVKDFTGTTLIAATEKPTVTNTIPYSGTGEIDGNAIMILAANSTISGFYIPHASRHGIYVQANGIDIGDVNISNIQTLDNDGRGVWVNARNGGNIDNVNITDITSLGDRLERVYVDARLNSNISNISLNNIEATGKANSNAVNINIATNNNSTINSTIASNLQVNNSFSSSGLQIRADNGGTMTTVNISNVEASGNTNGSGVVISSLSTTSGISNITNLSLSNAVANDNGTNGVQVNTSNGSHLNATLNNITGMRNGQFGMSASTSSAGTLQISMANSNIIANHQDGIRINYDGAGLIADLGGGGLSAGQNRIFGNGTNNTTTFKDIYVDLNTGVLKAENNWWGANADPTTAGRVRAESGGNSGTVDATPRLSTDPRP